MPVLFTFNLQTQDMAWAQKCRNDPVHLGIVKRRKADTLRGQQLKYANFEVSSFSRSIDISRGVKFKNVSRDPDNAHLRGS